MQTEKKIKPLKTKTALSGWLILPLALLIVGLLGVLVLTACGLLPGAAITGSLNPQPTLVLTVLPPSSTPTLIASPTPSPTPTWTLTPLPEVTTEPSSLPEKPGIPVSTEAPVPSQPSSMTFQVQLGAPWYIPAFGHQNQACRWVGLAGQVFGADGQGVDRVLVVVSGQLEGKPAEWMGMTALESIYGPGGYEISLADHLPEAAQVLSVQLFDLQGQALSDPFAFALPQSCERNLALVNFQPKSE